MFRLLLTVLLAVHAWAQQVVVHNVATAQQRSWTFVGLPDKLVPAAPGSSSPPSDDAQGFAYVPAAHGVWLLTELPPSTRAIVELQPAADDLAGQFELHRAIADAGVLQLVPTFTAKSKDGATLWTSDMPQFWAPGAPRPPAAFVRLIESDAAHQTWHLRTRIRGAAMTIDWWARIGSTCSTVEWTAHLVYGDTTAGQPIAVELGEVAMLVGTEPVCDFARRVNIPPPTPPATDPGLWRQQLMTPAWWSRACRVEVRGALLPVNDPARRQRPIGAVFTGWDGHWMALGQTPRPYAGAAASSASRLATYLNPPAGNQYDQRPACQPKVSGTTGEQPDFGAASGEEMVTQLSAWAVHDLLYHAQSYALRPTANKEPNGDPIRAVDHPRTVTTNQRPDHRFSAADMLGWPNPVPYSWPGTGYSTGDDQHRSDGILHALCALTRDPALLAIVADHIELQKLQLRPSDGPLGAPRAIGRVLLANCNQAWLGFDDAREFIRGTVEFVHRNAMFQRTPDDAAHPVRILAGTEEAKYGWKDAAGVPIRGWQGWQETIAAIGFLAAYRITGDERAREIALTVARTCTEQCFYHYPQDVAAWSHTYAQRWRTEDPGSAHPASSFFPVQPNYDINTDGACMRWTLASPRIFLLLSDQADLLRSKAQALAVAAPANWFDARWHAMGWR